VASTPAAGPWPSPLLCRRVGFLFLPGSLSRGAQALWRTLRSRPASALHDLPPAMVAVREMSLEVASAPAA
jgi:hypothetical protein